MKVKRVQHVSIPVPPNSGDKARAFYSGVLGIPEKKVPRELDASLLTWFAAGDDEHEIHCFTDADYENKSSGAHLCLEVDNLDEVRATLTRNNVQIDETIAIYNRPRLFVRDPFGNLIEITQINGPFVEGDA